MNLRINKYKIFYGMFIISLLGSILFFPVKINLKYTCFFHQILAENTNDISNEKKIVSNNENETFNIKNTNHSDSDSEAMELLHQYLNQYAFLWWGSLILLSTTIFFIQKEKYIQKKLTKGNFNE